MKLAEAREANDGKLPANAWPGGYPIVYLTGDGLTICPNCANEPDTSDQVVDGDVNWEGADMPCDDCGKMMASAYGDPEGPE